MSSSSPRHSITLKRRLRPFLESLNMPNSVRKTVKRRTQVRGLRARWGAPLRLFQTATGVRWTALTASCDVPELPSPEPCLAYAWSRPAENRLTHTYRPTAATSRRPRWPPTPSRRPLQPGRSTGYRCAGKPSLRSRFPSCRSRLSGPRGAPQRPLDHPRAATTTMAPVAYCRSGQSPITPISRPVPSGVSLHPALAPHWLVAAPPCRVAVLEALQQVPRRMPRHSAPRLPAPGLRPPPRRWACGRCLTAATRPLLRSGYSRWGGAIIAPLGVAAGGRPRDARGLPEW